MGIDDRDYMRDRARARERSDVNYSPKQYRGSWQHAGYSFAWMGNQKVVRHDRPVTLWKLIGMSVAIGVVSGILTWTVKHEWSRPTVALPENAEVTRIVPLRDGAIVAPLMIRTHPNQVNTHYFVEVSDWFTGGSVLTMFVVGGQAATTTLPLGFYRVTISQGKSWYGAKTLFGRRTVTRVAERPITISRASETQTVGATIMLDATLDGNFPMKPGERLAEPSSDSSNDPTS